MPIVDSAKPKQEVECDLCGLHFKRGLDSNHHEIFGDGWESVGVVMYFHFTNDETGKKGGSVRVDYACQGCQEELHRRVSEVVGEMSHKI